MNRAQELIKYVNAGVSPFHTVLETVEELEANGFKRLNMEEEWSLSPGGSYYVVPYGSTCFAFKISKRFEYNQGFRIIGAHTDVPCFRIKPSPEMTSDIYMKVNTEVYGGPILNTWLDRPLSVAGKIAIRSDKLFEPRMVFIDVEKPIFIIPNLAIHMNREVNKGVELNRQIDMLPVLGVLNDKLNKDNYFLDYLAKHLQVDVKDILDFDLFIYATEKGEVIGLNDDFISSPRLDDLALSYAAITSLIETEAPIGINVVALFDNEEVGSRTKQGADSNLFTFVLERVFFALNRTTSQYYRALAKSFMVSADAAHALHPNKPEKHDPTNRPVINQGLVIKMNANQKYATDSECAAIFQQICDANNIPYQRFVNRSDEAGGSTLGPISSAYLPIKAIDVGTPMLSMHSARELIGVRDNEYIIDAFKAFFTAE